MSVSYTIQHRDRFRIPGYLYDMISRLQITNHRLYLPYGYRYRRWRRARSINNGTITTTCGCHLAGVGLTCKGHRPTGTSSRMDK
jgi:hypothetical protein